MTLMAQVCGFVLCTFLGLLAATIIIWIWQGKIDLSALISEANGQASMSRFQLLIFTFVIAISLFILVEKRNDALPDVPPGVLTLLGISASTYAVGKGISYSQPDIMMATPPPADGQGVDEGDGQSAADQAKAHADEAKAHAEAAQKAAQETVDNAAKAKQAADQATGNQG
jgi:hypothetical protein